MTSRPRFLVTRKDFLEASEFLEREATQARGSICNGSSFHLSIWELNDRSRLAELRTDYSSHLRSFATALRGNHQIESLAIHERFYTAAGVDDASDHLLGEVLGSHPSLTRILLENGSLARKRFLTAFVSSVVLTQTNTNKLTGVTARLRHLHVSAASVPGFPDWSRPCNMEGMDCIARLLRENIPLETLCLERWSVSDGSGCNTIFQALDGNTHLLELKLIGFQNPERVGLSAVQALGRSKLRELTCKGVLEAGSEQMFARGLRTNASLERLFFYDPDYAYKFDYEKESAKATLFVDLLSTFNFHLRVLELPKNVLYPSKNATTIGPIQSRIDHILQCNTNVRTVHNHLQSLSYHHLLLVGPNITSSSSCNGSSIWPPTLEKISSKPSLVYRFIRHGNISAFTDHVVTMNTGKKRKYAVGC